MSNDDGVLTEEKLHEMFDYVMKGRCKVKVREKLENTLKTIEREIREMPSINSYSEVRATLTLAKVETLKALQKYE